MARMRMRSTPTVLAVLATAIQAAITGGARSRSLAPDGAALPHPDCPPKFYLTAHDATCLAGCAGDLNRQSKVVDDFGPTESAFPEQMRNNNPVGVCEPVLRSCNPCHTEGCANAQELETIPVWVYWERMPLPRSVVLALCSIQYWIARSQHSFELKLVTQDTVADYVPDSALATLPDCLTNGSTSSVLLSDFVRLLLLKEKGGVYLDASSYLLSPLDWLLDENGQLSHLVAYYKSVPSRRATYWSLRHALLRRALLQRALLCCGVPCCGAPCCGAPCRPAALPPCCGAPCRPAVARPAAVCLHITLRGSFGSHWQQRQHEHQLPRAGGGERVPREPTKAPACERMVARDAEAGGMLRGRPHQRHLAREHPSKSVACLSFCLPRCDESLPDP